ncbi:MAG: hypothetical protein EAZ92_02545 [Candidatus Kapaibacterium sp.]|nr:MAG: hypothetical protein EAZ92_02545 [Candidatus Kapabacteria bacterium]
MSTSAETVKSDVPKMIVFISVGLLCMMTMMLGAFYVEAYIYPWMKGKPERYGKTVLATPYPIVAEPNPKATESIEELTKIVLPAPKDDPGLTVREGLTLWLRADATPANTNEGDLVPIIPDASKNRNDARQIFPVARARYGSNGMNGKPGLFFDGKESFYYYENIFGVTPVSIYAVWSRPQLGGVPYQRLYSSGGWATDYENAAKTPAGQPAYNGAYANVFEPDGTEPHRDANGQPLAMPKEPTLHKQISATPLDLRRFMIGRLNHGPIQHFAGQLSEFVMFNRALSPAEQASVEDYLKKKYSLK